eukprot:s1005_g5.t1
MPMKCREDPSQPYLNQDDLNWIISQLYLRRVQIESLAMDMQSIQQALTKYMDKVTIMEGQLPFLRKLAHNKAPLHTHDHLEGSTSFLHRLDD